MTVMYAAVFAFGSNIGPAIANTSDEVGAVGTALYFCVALAEDTTAFELLLEDLKGTGWIETAAADLTDGAVSALAARGLAFQTTNTQVSSRWKPMYQTLFHNASGERRKKDVTGSVSTTYFIREDDPSLTYVHTVKIGDTTRTNCDIIVAEPLLETSQIDLPIASDLPTPVFKYPTENGASPLFSITQFDPARVASAVDVAFPFAAIFGVSPK
ncbi:MAG: hypothetical protein AAGA06_14195 [Pseudomonadota bacterium]